MIPADHTSIARGTYSDRWGTPDAILDLVREIYGPITLDLASSAAANRRVGAEQIYTFENPCPIKPPASPVVWCNPPGPGKRVKEFWQAWQHAVAWPRCLGGGFLIFKQDHWRQLPSPLRPMAAVVLRKRLQFVADVGAKPCGAGFPSTLILTPTARSLELAAAHGHVMIWSEA
jgi:hypothetical protein